MNDIDIIERYGIEVDESTNWYQEDRITITKEAMIKLLQESHGLKTINMPYRYIECLKSILEMDVTKVSDLQEKLDEANGGLLKKLKENN